MKKIAVPALLLMVVVVMQVVYWFFVSANIDTTADRGLFGDMFGGITALFSGLAFAGMIYAILLQSKELALQRKELELTRSELKASREAQAKTAEAQEELVEKQLISARIQAMAAIVQGKYQYAAAYGHNAGMHLGPAREAQEKLLEFIEEAGFDKIVLTDHL